jgi:hypothetical protein
VIWSLRSERGVFFELGRDAVGCVKKSQADGAVQAIGNAEWDFCSSALLRAETTVVQFKPASCRYDICPNGEVLARE